MGTDQSIKAAGQTQNAEDTAPGTDELNDAQLDNVSAGIPPRQSLPHIGHTKDNSVTIGG